MDSLMLLIPFTSDPANIFTVQLGDGNKYDFETRYNEGYGDVIGFWTFDLTRNLDGVRLVTGVKLLVSQDLIEPYALGMGRIIAFDESNADVEAGADDLGDRVKVYWFAAGELEAAAAASTA